MMVVFIKLQYRQVGVNWLVSLGEVCSIKTALTLSLLPIGFLCIVKFVCSFVCLVECFLFFYFKKCCDVT
jgi:hypothetical protein